MGANWNRKNVNERIPDIGKWIEIK
jgi:hypothetical protein